MQINQESEPISRKQGTERFQGVPEVIDGRQPQDPAPLPRDVHAQQEAVLLLAELVHSVQAAVASPSCTLKDGYHHCGETVVWLRPTPLPEPKWVNQILDHS